MQLKLDLKSSCSGSGSGSGALQADFVPLPVFCIKRNRSLADPSLSKRSCASGRFYLWAAVLASRIPAPCIQERTGVMPVGSGSSFMVRAPRGRLSWMENIRLSFWELCLHQEQDRRWRIILPAPAAQTSQRTTWIKVEKRGAMKRRGGGGRGAGGGGMELPQSAASWSREEPRVPRGFSGLGLDPSHGSELEERGEHLGGSGQRVRGSGIRDRRAPRTEWKRKVG